MASQNILESTVFAIQDQIKNNIATYLGEVRVDRNDGKITTEIPADYFIYDNAIAYKTPAIFTVVDSVDFQLSRGQNHINALIRVYVSCVVEDRNQRLLTLKIFRYQDALHKCLDRQHLINGDVQNIVKVTRTDISSSQAKQMSSTDSVFRKEIMMTLEVEHLESEN